MKNGDIGLRILLVEHCDAADMILSSHRAFDVDRDALVLLDVEIGLVGRLQYGYADGTWNEWHALFDGGKSGWLSEDNGAYVFAFDAPLQGAAPPADELVAGERRLVDNAAWSVASVTREHSIRLRRASS